MSGIAGIFNLDGRPVEQADLQKMVDSMPHRGLDGRHVWSDGPVGLGHCMLHTTPESLNETLPYTTEDGQLAITADARIDNREELFALLGLNGSSRSMPDSTLILKAYERWGEACVDHLLGDFAFAIWDGRERKVFCARDHLGLKPFYYIYQPGIVFVFATEIKSLLSLGLVSGVMSEVKLGYYLTGLREEQELTIYEGVLRLPHAHRLVVTSQLFRMGQYWTLEVPNELHLPSDEAYAEQFSALFEEAVRCRLRSCGPVGTHLSGGLDSTYITCVANKILQARNERLHTFSLTFEGLETADEQAYIKEVIDNYEGLEPHFLSSMSKGPLTDLDRIYSILDDGLLGGNYVNIWELLLAARSTGVRVVLDGIDGDSTVEHGYPLFHTLARLGDWEGFMHEAHLVAQRLQESKSAHYRKMGERFLIFAYNKYVLPYLHFLAIQGRVRDYMHAANAISRYFKVDRIALIRRYWSRLIQPERLIRWRESKHDRQRFAKRIRSDFARRIDLNERIREYNDPYRDPNLGMRERQRRLHMSGKRAGVFEIADHLAAACTTEVRHPFMDIRLVQYCLSLPERQSLNDGWTRVVMRRAMSGVVPDTITWRSDKGDMGDFFRQGLLNENRQRLERVLYEPGVLNEYTDMRIWQQQYENKDGLSLEETTEVGSIAILGYWINNKFSSKTEVEPVELETLTGKNAPADLATRIIEN